jgi:hypothetical protein
MNNRIFKNLNINDEINFSNNNYRNIFKKNNNTFMKRFYMNNHINYFNDMDDNINPNKFNFNNTMNNFYPKKKQSIFMNNINGNMINDYNIFQMKNINKNNYRKNNRINFNVMNDLNFSMDNLSIQRKLDLILKSDYKTVKISCTFKDKIKDILEKFRRLTHNYDNSQMRVFYKTKILNENLTVGQCGLNHNDIIIVLFGLVGGGEIQSIEYKAKYLEEKIKQEPAYQKYLAEKQNESLIQKYQKKQFVLNILYYDESLKDIKENSDNCALFRMNTKGTFYGCHNLDLFKIVCEKIKKSGKIFILLSSGSSAEKIFNYCINMNQIRECYIYCSWKEKYIPLLNKYSKLKGVYNNFNELKEKLLTIKEIESHSITSSNLIYFEDYSKIYIKLHYEIIRKYILLKKIKSENINKTKLLEQIEIHFPNFIDVARQLFPDKEEIINFFKYNTNESEKTIKEVFNCKDDIESYIRNYTAESFYYKYLNKFLRQGDFDSFRKLSSHISKFIYLLYEYRKDNIFSHGKTDLFRKMYISLDEVNNYSYSIGRVICFPSFTSTSIEDGCFSPTKYNPSDHLVKLIIRQNESKSVVSISNYSKFKSKKEYLFLPFSFFKIVDVRKKEGTL